VIGGDESIESIAIKNGMLKIEATSEAWKFLIRQIVEYMNALGAMNYLEQPAIFNLMSGPVELLITVQRKEGLSPAEVAAKAKEQARIAEAKIQSIIEIFERAEAYSLGEIVSEIALVVDWSRPVDISSKYDPKLIITLPEKMQVAQELLKQMREADAERASKLDNYIAQQTNEQN